MSNLEDIARETLENFDPATDSVDSFEKIPDGEYLSLIEEATARVNDKGTNWISLKCSILQGDYENRLIFVNYFFTEKMTQRSIKAIKKLCYDCGYNLPIEAFATYEDLATALNTIAGTQVIIKQTTSKNDFTNYTVTPVGDSSEDLPF